MLLPLPSPVTPFSSRDAATAHIAPAAVAIMGIIPAASV